MPQKTANLAFLVCGMPPVIVSLYFILTESDQKSDNARRHTRHCLIGHGATIMITELLMTQTVRNLIYPALNSLASKGDAGRAAGVAALIGKRDVKTVLAQARRSFMGVPFSHLALEHFESNQLDGAMMKDLAQRCQLGEVDAFLSHSWHDSPQAKWDALVSWSAAFEGRHGRPPVLWFDKVSVRRLELCF